MQYTPRSCAVLSHTNKGFDTELEAAIAYDEVSKRVYGDEPNKDLINRIRNKKWQQVRALCTLTPQRM